MKGKKDIVTIAIISLLMFGVGFLLAGPEQLGLCVINDISCSNKIGEGICMPLFMFAAVTFIITLTLFFSVAKSLPPGGISWSGGFRCQ